MLAPRTVLVLLEPDRDEQPALVAGRKIAEAFGAALEQSADLESAFAGWAGLVVKFSAWQSPLERTLFTGDDWRLIRDCPAPLLLVKDPTLLTQPRVLVCVDPMHANDKPAALDHALLGAAESFVERLGGAVQVLHVLAPPPSLSVIADSYVAPVPAEAGSTGLEHGEAALRELLALHSVSVDNARLRAGTPARVIVEEARELRVSLVIMGAVSRGRLARWLVGSTAEAVLDRLACNVLIVKPVAPD